MPFVWLWVSEKFQVIWSFLFYSIQIYWFVCTVLMQTKYIVATKSTGEIVIDPLIMFTFKSGVLLFHTLHSAVILFSSFFILFASLKTTTTTKQILYYQVDLWRKKNAHVALRENLSFPFPPSVSSGPLKLSLSLPPCLNMSWLAAAVQSVKGLNWTDWTAFRIKCG